MTARRSRTGCATCRKRKLKCDEAKPICGQCTKSRRECVPSDGVAFRHEQNAGLNCNIQGDQRSLGNFYKYRNDYTAEQLRNFVSVPSSLEWRHVTDVYADDTEQASPRHGSSPQAYQREVASHSLEALSTAAAENQSYQPPVIYDINNLYPGGNGGYGPVSGPNQNNNIKFLLNPSSTSAAMIDPNLDTAGLDAMKVTVDENGNDTVVSQHDADDKAEEAQQNVTSEEQVAFLLKNYEEQPA